MEETQRPTTKLSGTPHGGGPRGASIASQSQYWWDTSSIPAASSIGRSGSTASTFLGGGGGPTQPPPPPPAASSSHHHSSHASTGSMALAIERVLEQCDARGLQSTAVWLGELLLAASPVLLEQTSSNYPLTAPSVPLDGRERTLASMGRLLLQSREYLRCHHLLKGALPTTNTSVAVVEADALHRQQQQAAAAAAMARGSSQLGGSMRLHGGRSISSIRPSEGRGEAWGGAGLLDDDDQLFPADVTISGTAGHGATPLQHVHHQPRGSLSMPDAWRATARLSGDVGGAAGGRGQSILDSGASPVPPPVHHPGPHGPQGPHQGTAAASLPARRSNTSESSTVVFLALYALYMEGQRQRTLAPIASRSQPNANLRTLRLHLQPALDAFPQDPYLLWLHAVVLRDANLKQEAATVLIQAVRINPFLWCAWQDLACLVTRESQLQDIATSLRVHHQQRGGGGGGGATGNAMIGVRQDTQLMFLMFAAHVRGDLGYHTVALVDWEELLVHFPTSSFIRCHIGTCLYNRKDFEGARGAFEDVRETDPYRVEGTDEHSNVLFVRGDRVGLSRLAQQCYILDPYRPETNCVLGNYYAMAGRHDKSLFYFKRAVTIDPLYLSGWTLMGHEYLEMKNTAAAVEAYRTAVEIDQRDYRAWYGLGQIYELLHMHHHALYYYWHTTTLRPTDPRMWSAVANCLDQCGRSSEAISCLERAEQYEPAASDHYPQLVRRIAEHYLSEANHVGRHYHNGNAAAPAHATRGPTPTSRAMTFLEKLIACERRKPEDLLFAIPALTETQLSRIHEAFNIPTRSPSYDPSQAHQRSSGSGPGASSHSSNLPRTDVDANAVQEALATLSHCEQHLALLLRTVPLPSQGGGSEGGDGSSEGPRGRSGSDGGAQHQQHQQASVSHYVTQAQSGIQYIRGLLSAQQHHAHAAAARSGE